MTSPDPLVARGVEVPAGFVLDTHKLLGSELMALASAEELKAAVLLWCRAWNQKPAASLPDDDRVLASFAQVSAARWPKLRVMALRGFVKCSDGRLYHPLLAADANRAWKALSQRRAAIKKRWATTEATEADTAEAFPGTPSARPIPVPIPEPVPGPSHSENEDGGDKFVHDGGGNAGDGGRTRIAPDWRPSPADRDFAAGLGLDAAAILGDFRDYWIGDGRAKADWSAVFRHRCRQLAAAGGRPVGQRQGDRGIVAAAHRILARLGDE